jgi:hypothetical protein
MKSRYAAVFVVTWVVLCALIGATAVGSETRSGNWIMSRSDTAGKVHFSLVESRHGGHSEFGSDWPLNVFQGLDRSKSGRHEVHFTVSRDAGRFDCEGFLDNDEGAGLFHFFPRAQYAQEMKSLGFDGIEEEKQLAMAAQEVSLEFAKEMKSEHLEGLDTDKLIAFRIFGVTTGFINDVRAAGLNISDSDKLVAFRIHGVTPEMIRRLHREGYDPDEDKLIALRIHGATPEWMAQISQRGYTHLELDELIAFRIHGVTPEFIDKLKELGYSHPEPDQLISMRIHGVTPDYIANMRAQHGMKDLTIDQLVNLRIHGID